MVIALGSGLSGCGTGAQDDGSTHDGGNLRDRSAGTDAGVSGDDRLTPRDGTRVPEASSPETLSSSATEDAGCHPVAAAHPEEGALHYEVCSPTNYQTNPPSSGNHYSTWAAYKTYTAPFSPGFWVHNLEHGAIVITYRCADGCPSEVAAAQALIDSLPSDPTCDPVLKRRIIMLPNPDLTVRFAASSWGFTLRADCFDRAAFSDFIAEHYNHGREDLCTDGLDPLTGRGGSPICTP